jgi:DNA-binding GntR family transcriptional regulator
MDEIEYEQLEEGVYNGIVSLLLRGAVAPGQKLNQLELSAALSASRTPINSALSRLEGMMLVEKLPRRGARVRPYAGEELRRVLRLLALLGGAAVEELCGAPRRRPPLAVRAALRRAAGSDAAEGELERAYRLLAAFAGAVPDHFLGRLLGQLALIVLVNGRREADLLERLRRALEGLLAAVEARDLVRASARWKAVVDALPAEVAEGPGGAEG